MAIYTQNLNGFVLKIKDGVLTIITSPSQHPRNAAVKLVDRCSHHRYSAAERRASTTSTSVSNMPLATRISSDFSLSDESGVGTTESGACMQSLFGLVAFNLSQLNTRHQNKPGGGQIWESAG